MAAPRGLHPRHLPIISSLIPPNPSPRPSSPCLPNLILPSLPTSITSGLCFWEQEAQKGRPARHEDSVAMEMGLKKRGGGGYCPGGSDKGSTMLLQRGGRMKLKETQKDMRTGEWGVQGCHMWLYRCYLRWAGRYQGTMRKASISTSLSGKVRPFYV